MNHLQNLYEFFRLVHQLTVPFEKSKTVLFASSVMKYIVAPSALSRFPVNLICYFAFRSASSFCFLLKPITINL